MNVLWMTLKGNRETPQRLCEIAFHSPATSCKQVCRQPQLQTVNPVGIWRKGEREGEEVAGREEGLPPFLKDERKEGMRNRFVVALPPQATHVTDHRENQCG